jgi:hypothetical protein
MYMVLTSVRVAEVFSHISSGARGFHRRELAVGYMHVNILFFNNIYFVSWFI